MMITCCAPVKEIGNVADVPTQKVINDGPPATPMWLEDAEAAQQAAEESAKKRLEELVAKRALEEERKKKNEEERIKAEEEAKAAAEAGGDDAKAAAQAAAAQQKSSAKANPKTKAKAKAKTKAKAAAPAAAAPAASQAAPAEKSGEPSKAKFEFEVKIDGARGLRDADWLAGTSDPYCIVESVGVAKQKFKTKVVDNKQEPVWNQKVKMTLNYGDKIKFTINDYDVGKEDDLLGWVEVPFDDMITAAGVDGELKLRDASETAKAREAYLKCRVKLLRSYNPEDEAAKAEAAK